MPFPPLHAGAAVSAPHADRILNGLRDRSLPEKEWTHGAHLTAAVMLLDEMGLKSALAAMPDMIRTFNIAKGGENTDDAGYHHSITVFYLVAINEFCRGCSDLAPHERATALLSSPLADKAYPLTFYSKDLLFSVEARRGWVEPDLKALPVFTLPEDGRSEAQDA